MNIQIDMFSMLADPDLFTIAVQHGSGFAGGKNRIMNAVNESTGDIRQLASFLKKEYGIGGWGGPGIEHVLYDGKGMSVGADWKGMVRYSWDQVAKRILELVALGRY